MNQTLVEHNLVSLEKSLPTEKVNIIKNTKIYLVKIIQIINIFDQDNILDILQLFI